MEACSIKHVTECRFKNESGNCILRFESDCPNRRKGKATKLHLK